MRIVFCTSGIANEYEDYRNGNLLGTEYQVFWLARALAQKGNDVYILRNWDSPQFEEKIDGVTIINLNTPHYINSNIGGIGLSVSVIGRIFNQLIFSYIARKILNQLDADILCLTSKFSSLLISTIKIKKIFILHTVPYELLPAEFHSLKWLKTFHPMIWIEKFIYSNCNSIVSLNRCTESYIQEKGYEVIFIPNGVAIMNYQLNCEDSNYILFGGRLVKEKGIDCLMHAYSMLNENLKARFALIIVGFGADELRLKNLANDLKINKKVKFIPWLCSKDFIQMISKCSIFVLPSFFECMPVSILEAMALNKPIIASDIPGSNDIINHMENGLLFKKGDINSLKNCLELFLNHDLILKDFVKNEQNTIKKYSFENISEEYLKLFNKLLL
jgi:glycosyltransferase involved in cell wall biosynthesis